MTKPIPKYRKNLNSEQLEVLELLYKFRFGSNNLIAEYFGKKQRGFVFKRLKILEEQGYIGKRFESSYRIQGKPAAYYLLPAGARKLQERHNPEDINVKAIYKDKSVSESFIQHSHNIFSVYNQLKTHYDSKLNFFTKSDLTSFEHFPKPLPDGFLSLEVKKSTGHFFLEIIEDSQPFFATVRKIKKYIDYNESGEWDITETDFPTILFICESTSLQKRLQKQLLKQTNDYDDCTFATTTKAELRAMDTDDAIWLTDDPDEKLSLSLI